MSKQDHAVTFSDSASFSGPTSLWNILLADWRVWLPGAVFSFLLASVLLSGGPAGLIPNLSYPYIYAGDGLSYSWVIQRAIEGWIFENPRSGYPFGASFLDYPGSDAGNFIILKILGLITGKYYSALNLYVLLSFPASFITAFLVLRAIGLNVWYGFTAAILFVFLPFHFQRIGHLLYVWYFVVPLFFYLAFYLFYFSPEKEQHLKKTLNLLVWFIILLILSSFGVYYAVFGCILLLIGGMAGWVRNRFANMKWGMLAILIVIFGVLINTVPNIVNTYVNGPNAEVAVRPAAHAEYYGFKMMQLVIPRDHHRSEKLAAFKKEYNDTRPLITENTTAALGIVGTIGFLLLGGILLIRLSGGNTDSRLAFLALCVLVLFLFGTIGGLGSLFSTFISSSIRSWNRISVFLAFGPIAAFFLIAQALAEKYVSPLLKESIIPLSAIVILGVGLYDQTTPASQEYNAHTKLVFEMDRDFIQKIEHSLPPNSAIYQLPYIAFPESGPSYHLEMYDLVAGFLHSKTLRWSFGGMKGREGDSFYRSLSNEPIETQVDIIKRLGFSGIYLDGRGYEDNGQKMKESLTKLLGPPTLVRSDNKVFFFQFEPVAVNFDGLTNEQIMQKVGYVVLDGLGKRYKGSLAEGIDFSRSDWPDFISKVSGLSGAEPWGRWSDANLDSKVRLDFFQPLPEKFIFVLKAQPFGPNTNQPLTVKIGSQTHQIKMTEGVFEAHLPIDLKNEKVEFIELIPPYPTSPGGDPRRLGVGLISIRFEGV